MCSVVQLATELFDSEDRLTVCIMLGCGGLDYIAFCTIHPAPRLSDTVRCRF